METPQALCHQLWEEWLAGCPQALLLPALWGSVVQGEARQGKGWKAGVTQGHPCFTGEHSEARGGEQTCPQA